MARSKVTGGVFVILLALVDLCSTSACEVSGREESGGGSSERMDRATVDTDRHLLLIVERGRAGFRIDEVHVVAGPLPTTRAPRLLRWRADILDVAGRTLVSESIPESGILRGAFADPDGTTESIQKRLETFSFALRLPLVRNAAHIRFSDTSPDEPGGALPLAPIEVELGVVPYPADVR